MTDIETTEPGAEDERARWLVGPPPPPPEHQGSAGGSGRSAPQGRRALATHSPLSGKDWSHWAGHLRVESPWMLTSAAVLLALAVYWIASVVAAFQHGNHITAQVRALRVFMPGSLLWVLGVVLAVALFSAGRRFEVPPASGGPLRTSLAMGLVLAGAAAVASSAMSFIVELTNFGNGIASTIAGLIGYAGTLVLALAIAFWANREHEASSAPPG